MMLTTGEIEGAVRLAQQYNIHLYRTLIRELVDNPSKISKLKVELEEYTRSSMMFFNRLRQLRDAKIPFACIRDEQIQVFIEQVERNDRLRQEVYSIQRVLWFMSEMGQTIPMATKNVIEQGFPELCVTTSSDRVPLNILCYHVMHKYNLRNENHILALLQLAVMEINSPKATNPVPKRVQQRNQIFPSYEPTLITEQPLQQDVEVQNMISVNSTEDKSRQSADCYAIIADNIEELDTKFHTLTEAKTGNTNPNTVEELQVLDSQQINKAANCTNSHTQVVVKEMEDLKTSNANLSTVQELQDVTQFISFENNSQQFTDDSTISFDINNPHTQVVIKEMEEVKTSYANPNTVEELLDVTQLMSFEDNSQQLTDDFMISFDDIFVLDSQQMNNAVSCTNQLPQVAIKEMEEVTSSNAESNTVEELLDVTEFMSFEDNSQQLTDDFMLAFDDISVPDSQQNNITVSCTNPHTPVGIKEIEEVKTCNADPNTVEELLDVTQFMSFEDNSQQLTDDFTMSFDDIFALDSQQINNAVSCTHTPVGIKEMESVPEKKPTSAMASKSKDEMFNDILSVLQHIPELDQHVPKETATFSNLSEDETPISYPMKKIETAHKVSTNADTKILAMTNTTKINLDNCLPLNKQENTNENREHQHIKYDPRNRQVPLSSWEELMKRFTKPSELPKNEWKDTTPRQPKITEPSNASVDIVEKPTSMPNSSCIRDTQESARSIVHNTQKPVIAESEGIKKLQITNIKQPVQFNMNESPKVQKPLTNTSQFYQLKGTDRPHVYESKIKRKQHGPIKHDTKKNLTSAETVEIKKRREEQIRALEIAKERTKNILNQQIGKSSKVKSSINYHKVVKVPDTGPKVGKVFKTPTSSGPSPQTPLAKVNVQEVKPDKYVPAFLNRKRPAAPSKPLSPAKRARRQLEPRIMLRIFKDNNEWNVEQVFD